MQVWLVHDNEERGGFYSVWSFRPQWGVDLTHTEDEVRTLDIPDTLWDQAINAQLPRDPDESNDSTWEPLWETATVIWVKE